MPYVPTPDEAHRLRRAIEIAKFSEGERIAWLFAFASLVTLEVILVATGATWAGALGAFGGFLVLYWRLRAGHWSGREPSDDLKGLFGVDLRSRDQRAFTALMLRQVFTGRNPLVPREATEHDPVRVYQERVERARANK